MSKIQERTDVTFSNAKLAFFKKKAFREIKLVILLYSEGTAIKHKYKF